ncbi:hypothetical protein R6Q59_009486 [Mikania micrantha]
MTGLSWTAIKYAGGGRSGGPIIQEDYKERRIAGKFLMKMIKFDMFDNQKMLQQELKQVNLEIKHINFLISNIGKSKLNKKAKSIRKNGLNSSLTSLLARKKLLEDQIIVLKC